MTLRLHHKKVSQCGEGRRGSTNSNACFIYFTQTGEKFFIDSEQQNPLEYENVFSGCLKRS